MILNTGLRTDIPAFFSEWFYNRIKEGHIYVRNPYNKNQIYKYKLNPELIDCIIFCTKNPQPMFKEIDKISQFNQLWFITITPYDNDIEPNVPHIEKVIESFKYLSNLIGKEKIIWRYDPILINEKYNLDYHIKSFNKIAKNLSNYTDEAIISFIDLYEKTKRNFPNVKKVTIEETLKIGKEFSKIGKEHNIKIKTCAEGNNLEKFGIDSSGCMTKEVIERAIGSKLNIPKRKVRSGQCECILNNDIGEYNSCGHGCLYCYANSNKSLVRRNLKYHNPKSPLLIGDLKETDIIKEIEQKSNISNETTIQTKLF